MSAPGRIISQIPELSATQSIHIAPHTSVPVTQRLLRIIDSKTFQRLRQIRQLSLSDRVFPSATHTRFSHALGVYNNILDYLRHLDSYPEFYHNFSEADYVSLLLAGLLHDLGHYPCAHQLDHVSPFPRHETLTIALIRGELRVENEDFHALLEDTFQIEAERVTRLLEPAEDLSPHHRLLKQIIDSPVDADKCDYLPRDSYYCGVDYGTGFDRERFIKNLAPSGDGRLLCILEKGIMSAERFQLARYWMYRTVYWGHTVRALITMLSKACEYLLEPDRVRAHFPHLLSLSDHNFLEWLHDQVAPPARELIRMIHLERRPFKRFYTVSPHHQPEIYARLQQREIRDSVSAWVTRWAADRGIPLEPCHLIWDVPPIYKTTTWESFPVKLNSGREVPIAQESPVIDALSRAFLQGVRKIRLFCHPKLAGLLDTHRDEIPRVADLIQPRRARE